MLFTAEFPLRWKAIGQRYLTSVVGRDFSSLLSGSELSVHCESCVYLNGIGTVFQWGYLFMPCYSKRYLIGMALIVKILTLFSAVGIPNSRRISTGSSWFINWIALVDDGYPDVCWLWGRHPDYSGWIVVCPICHVRRCSPHGIVYWHCWQQRLRPYD